jgi:hypothetical protein
MQFLQQLTVIHPALLCRPSITIKIENPPYMSLTVENIGLGPRGLPTGMITSRLSSSQLTKRTATST